MKLSKKTVKALGLGSGVVFGGGLMMLGLSFTGNDKEVEAPAAVQEVVTDLTVEDGALLMSEAPVVESQEQPEKDAVEVIQLAPLVPKETLAIKEYEVDVNKATNAIERKRLDFNKKFEKFIAKDTKALKKLVETKDAFITDIATARDLNAKCFVLNLTEKTRESCGTDIWAISNKGEVYKLK